MGEYHGELKRHEIVDYMRPSDEIVDNMRPSDEIVDKKCIDSITITTLHTSVVNTI